MFVYKLFDLLNACVLRVLLPDLAVVIQIPDAPCSGCLLEALVACYGTPFDVYEDVLGRIYAEVGCRCDAWRVEHKLAL